MLTSRTLLALAQTWELLELLWENIKYMSWLPADLSEPRDLTIYLPPDLDEFLKFEVGHTRMNEIRVEFAAQSLASTQFKETSNTLALMSRIANSVTVPEAGDVWNGNIDIAALKKGVKRTWAASRGISHQPFPLRTTCSLCDTRHLQPQNIVARILEDHRRPGIACRGVPNSHRETSVAH